MIHHLRSIDESHCHFKRTEKRKNESVVKNDDSQTQTQKEAIINPEVVIKVEKEEAKTEASETNVDVVSSIHSCFVSIILTAS